MVSAISDAKLASLNIDTIERAIVISALALKMAIIGANEEGYLSDKIKMTTEEKGANETYLALDVSLPYNSYVFADEGGKMINAIRPYDFATNISVNSLLSFNVTPTTPPPTKYKLDPPSFAPYPLQWLEKYFYYHASLLYAALDDNRNEIITIVLVSNQVIRTDEVTGLPIDSKSEVRVQVNLPIDPKKWGQNKNLVECVQRVVLDSNSSGGNPNTLSLLTDTNLLTDLITLVD